MIEDFSTQFSPLYLHENSPNYSKISCIFSFDWIRKIRNNVTGVKIFISVYMCEQLYSCAIRIQYRISVLISCVRCKLKAIKQRLISHIYYTFHYTFLLFSLFSPATPSVVKKIFYLNKIFEYKTFIWVRIGRNMKVIEESKVIRRVALAGKCVFQSCHYCVVRSQLKETSSAGCQ